MKIINIIVLSLLISNLNACSQKNHSNVVKPESMEEKKVESTEHVKGKKDLETLEKAYFASGCFWCVEAIFESVNGVEEAISGYAGGEIKNPTYELVSSGRIKHAEVVEVYYDPQVVSFKTLLEVFFGSHDPTTYHRQGPDRGPQYRSIAFFQNDIEKQSIIDYIEKLQTTTYAESEIVTEVSPFEVFYPAEGYHQNYEVRNPGNPYVKAVSVPRLNRFKTMYPELLKSNAH